MASTPDRPKGKSLSDLGMVWDFARHYPGHITCAAIALLFAAATSGVPYAFQVDHRPRILGGDIARWFQYLLFLVLVMALATSIRFYFVSWLGRACRRRHSSCRSPQPAALAPGFFEEPAAEITSRITVDTTIIEQVVGTTVSVALRNLVMGTACA
jgi:ATP-binding cassette subfamily B protein